MKNAEEIKKIAKKCIETEYSAIEKLHERIDDNFVSVVELILGIKGRLIVTAIGKSANIASKMVATLNSTGQPSIFLHAADAIHGDLGNIQDGDVVMCISNSGNTSEIKQLIPLIMNMNINLIAMTGNMNSYLAKEAKFVLDVSVEAEACPNNLAPTSSSTAQLVMGDALAMSLLSCKDFSDKDFARFHPGGMLGKRLLLRLSDLVDFDNKPCVNEDASLHDVIFEISNKRLGAVVVVEKEKVIGIITDGDLRRMLEKEENFQNLKAKDIMNKNPKTMDLDDLAYKGLKIMEQYNISQLVILSQEEYIGIVHIHEIIKEGIV